MWTPKRALLLVLGLTLSCVAYAVYATFLGYVDGLPPLPPGYAEIPDEGVPPPVPQDDENRVERKLRTAFGDDCPELQRTIKIEVNRYRLALASDHFSIEPDGRVKLAPFSIAIFGDNRDGAKIPEINTIRSDVAYLTFDQPVATLADIGNRKIIGGELRRDPKGHQEGPDAGGVQLVNNRRTPQRDDDLTMFTPGPVYYQEKLFQAKKGDKQPHIWTREAVRLIDEQSRPNPTTIVAIGLDVYLATEEETNKPSKRKRKRKKARGNRRANIGITGVKSIRLRSDVDMYLWVDGDAGFLGSENGGKPAATKDKPAAKAQVQIKTQGPFFYDVLTDKARFDISQHPGPYPNNVMVRRSHVANGPCDQLVCDHLELQFQREQVRQGAASGDRKAPPNDRQMQLQIESAHAWGSQVTLTSDAEGLTAFGNDLLYNAKTRTTILRGNPEMVAMKDGNEIYAKELILISGDKGNAASQAQAKGPGHLRIFDRNTGQRTLKASWTDMLTSTKDGKFDLLVLTGDASFEDKEHDQNLHAEQLKIWLRSANRNQKNAKEENRRPRPHHLEAVGGVKAQSAELIVHDTDRLVVWFKDSDKPAKKKPAATLPRDKREAGKKPGEPRKPSSARASPAKTKQRQPVDLSARSVEVYVRQEGQRNELERLWCQGMVRVHQDPKSADDKGIDIRGQTLQLLQFPEGHILTVTGDLAEVQLDKLTIYGPEINIDQKDNKATVTGLGAMRLPSQASFQGGKLKEPTELMVHWNRDMFFNGKYALFHGGVQAEQDNARLTCQTMQVFLDKFVSLKEGQRSGPAAKVENLVCDQTVRVEDAVFKNGKVERYQRIDSTQLSLNNEDGVVKAPGPGVVRIMQPAPKDDTKPDGEMEMRLTRINYIGSMFANNTSRIATFYDSVELVHLPTDEPDLHIDIDNLPDRGFYLRCDLLRVYSRRLGNGQTHQQMAARGRAMVQANEFSGRADVIKYDEQKELVIFEASEGNLATLYRQTVRGAQPQVVKGRKIYYWRKTNDFKIEGAVQLQGRN